MFRCLELGRKGFPAASPNPAVGCLIEFEGKVLGEGYTQAFGGPHAEVMALLQVKEKALLSRSTLYVSLEPCSHFGKTPPCVDRIIESGVARVVVGLLDPNPLVAGQGIEKLLKAGLQVHVGLCEAQIRSDLRYFLTAQEQKRPYTILKWAETSDGYLAPLPESRQQNAPVWISNTLSRQRVHKLRAEVQAILVGWKTAVQDAAQLTVRDWEGNSPHRVLIDPQASTPGDTPILNSKATTTVFLQKNAKPNSLKGHQIQPYSPEEGNKLPQKIASYLHSIQCNSLLVEGGRATLLAYLDSDLWDEIHVFKGNQRFGAGILAPEVQGTLYKREFILNDSLLLYKHPNNPYVSD